MQVRVNESKRLKATQRKQNQGITNDATNETGNINDGDKSKMSTSSVICSIYAVLVFL